MSDVEEARQIDRSLAAEDDFFLASDAEEQDEPTVQVLPTFALPQLRNISSERMLF